MAYTPEILTQKGAEAWLSNARVTAATQRAYYATFKDEGEMEAGLEGEL